MSFIIAIVVVIFYFSLSNRLSSLEREVKKLKGVEGPQPAQVHPVVSEQHHEAMPVAAPKPVQVQSTGLDEQAGGKVLAVIGIIAVFLGLAFFLKYAFDNNLIGITGRIILGYATGILAVVLGLSIRKKYAEYADTLTGGGIAVLYLTTFAAYAFYSLFTSGVAYFILVIIAGISVAISVMLESQALAALAIIGAYFTPMIMSIYKVDALSLFTYLLIINIGNATIAYWYKWTKLNLIGVLGTFALSYLWFGTRHIEDADRLLVFLFHSIYFAIYLAAGMMHHCFRKQNSDGADGIFVMLNGLLYAGIGYTLLQPLYPDSMGIFMLVIAVIYFFAALISFETNKADKLMNAILPALSALFITIAIPIHFDGAAIPVLWVTEALLMFVIEYSVKGKNLYVYGTMVYILGLINIFAFHVNINVHAADFSIITNERFMLFAYTAIAAYAMAYIASVDSRRAPHETAGGVKVIMAIFAEVVTLAILTLETNAYFDQAARTTETNNAKNTAVSIMWIIYATLLTAIGFAGRYRTLRIGGLLLFFFTAFKIFVDLWALGALYRIIASIVFGVVALAASFAYTKFKDRLFVE